MYTVSKGPSKIVAKTRRGISQNYEKFDAVREINKRPVLDSQELSVPKPVFLSTKKSSNSMRNSHNEQNTISPQHEELVKYIHESWNMVVAQNPYDLPNLPDHISETTCNSSMSSSSSSSASSVSSLSSVNSASVYYSDPPSPVLSDFKPFDLESWWGRRLFNNITKSL